MRQPWVNNRRRTQAYRCVTHTRSRMNTMQLSSSTSRDTSMIAEVWPQDQDFVLHKLNAQFVSEDAAIIQDVAASCEYNCTILKNKPSLVTNISAIFTDERSYKALSDLFGPSNAASSEPLTNAPKVTNQQHSQINTLSSQRQHTQAMSMGEVNTSNVQMSKETAIRSVTPVMETAPTWGGPNRITGAIRKTPCAIKNSKFKLQGMTKVQLNCLGGSPAIPWILKNQFNKSDKISFNYVLTSQSTKVLFWL